MLESSHFPFQTRLIFIFFEKGTRWRGTDLSVKLFFGSPFTSVRLHSKHYVFIQFRLCTSHTSGSVFLLRYLSLCASADVAADEMMDDTGGNGGSRWSPFHTEKPAVGVALSSRLLCEPSWLLDIAYMVTGCLPLIFPSPNPALLLFSTSSYLLNSLNTPIPSLSPPLQVFLSSSSLSLFHWFTFPDPPPCTLVAKPTEAVCWRSHDTSSDAVWSSGCLALPWPISQWGVSFLSMFWHH